jgi:chaperonin cofactor prefoldin
MAEHPETLQPPSPPTLDTRRQALGERLHGLQERLQALQARLQDRQHGRTPHHGQEMDR